MGIRPEAWLPEWWRRNFLVYEFWLAVGATALLIAWGTFLGGYRFIDGALAMGREDFYGLLVSVLGVLFGFIIAATSIVLSVSNKPQLYWVRENNYHHQLWDVLFSSIKILGLATMLALLGFLFDRQNSPSPWLTYINLGAIFLVVLRLVRCVWILEHIVRIVGESTEEDKKEEIP